MNENQVAVALFLLGIAALLVDKLVPEVPSIILEILAGACVLGALGLLVHAWRNRRADENVPPGSTFARLTGGSEVESEQTYSSAETFYDLDEGSRAISRDDVHDPHGQKAEQEDEVDRARDQGERPGS